jgi:putative cell wall-binding protein
MKRIAAPLLALATLVAASSPARAGGTGDYTHFGATNNVSLSVQFSQQLFGVGSSVAILVRSDSFADSLAAGALAGVLDAPVLMNPPGAGLDARISNELARLGVDLVVVVGGTAAVSDQTEADLASEGYTVSRRAGANRVATAAAVMAMSDYDGAETVYIARAFGTGSSGFADSLGAGMLAGTNGGPLVITDTATLSSETQAAIEARSSLTRAVIVGGTAAVSGAVESQLRGLGLDVERIAGATRFETAALTADQSFDPGRSRVVAIVDGLHTNSWASGYPASAAAGGAVVLSDGSSIPAPTRSFLESQATGIVYCAPEVTHEACEAADVFLNG